MLIIVQFPNLLNLQNATAELDSNLPEDNNDLNDYVNMNNNFTENNQSQNHGNQNGKLRNKSKFDIYLPNI